MALRILFFSSYLENYNVEILEKEKVSIWLPLTAFNAKTNSAAAYRYRRVSLLLNCIVFRQK